LHPTSIPSVAGLAVNNYHSSIPTELYVKYRACGHGGWRKLRNVPLDAAILNGFSRYVIIGALRSLGKENGFEVIAEGDKQHAESEIGVKHTTMPECAFLLRAPGTRF
jgi:hypothetical protein